MTQSKVVAYVPICKVEAVGLPVGIPLYKTFFRPLLFRLDAEQAHLLVHGLAHKLHKFYPLIGKSLVYKGNDLTCQLFGKKLNNPIGLAAGFDKNGDLVEILSRLGFGFAEIGSVTALAKEGNPKPRLFRLEKDEAIINRMGLNGEGADAITKKLERKSLSLPLGLNIAKTNDPSIVGDAAIEDIVHTFTKIKTLPLTYVAINASCPNTNDSIAAQAAYMRTIFVEVQKLNTKQLPILLKLSPDSSQDLVEELVEAASVCGLSGFICGNTTTSRKNLATDTVKVQEIGAGGLSGTPLKNMSLELCRTVYSLKKPSQIIIGCGGISSGWDAYEFLAAGASFLQIYTGLVYEGPALLLSINQQLSAILRQNRQTLQEAIGTKATTVERQAS